MDTAGTDSEVHYTFAVNPAFHRGVHSCSIHTLEVALCQADRSCTFTNFGDIGRIRHRMDVPVGVSTEEKVRKRPKNCNRFDQRRHFQFLSCFVFCVDDPASCGSYTDDKPAFSVFSGCAIKVFQFFPRLSVCTEIKAVSHPISRGMYSLP